MDIIPQDSRVLKGSGVSVANLPTDAPVPSSFSVPVNDLLAQLAVQPPPTNRGAERTRALVDWLGFTMHGRTMDEVLLLLGPGDWQDAERGGMGYVECRFRGDARVYSGGAVGMGIHVEVSGQGCRQLEEAGVLDVPCPELGVMGGWRGYLSDLIEAGAKLTRLDVAIDDREGLLSLNVIEQAIKEGCVVSRFRQGRLYVDYDFSEGRSCGTTAYFGSPQSQMFVRMYNKAEQLMLDAHWVRVEIQARASRAAQLAEAIIAHGMGCVASVLRNYIDIKEASATDSNRRRWSTVGWWDAFLDAADKLALTVAPAAKSLGEVADRFKRQYGATLAMLATVQSFGKRFLDECILDGASRWRAKHVDMMRAAVEAEERSPHGWGCLMLANEGGCA